MNRLPLLQLRRESTKGQRLPRPLTVSDAGIAEPATSSSTYGPTPPGSGSPLGATIRSSSANPIGRARSTRATPDAKYHHADSWSNLTGPSHSGHAGTVWGESVRSRELSHSSPAAPNSWEEQVEMIRQFVAGCGTHLSSHLRADQPERYAMNYEELIRSYVDALRSTSSIFRRL